MKHVTSERNNKPMSRSRTELFVRWVAAAGLGLFTTAFATAQPRAQLLPPIAAKPYLPRASSEEVPTPEMPPPVTTPSRDTGFVYPPTYSSGRMSREFPQLMGLWNRITKPIEASDEKKRTPQSPSKESAKSIEAPPKVIRQDPSPRTVSPTPQIVQPMQPVPPSVPPTKPFVQSIQPTHPLPQHVLTIQPPPVPSTIPPAWKWYGYGAAMPGSNSLAPTGRYGTVQPSWHGQTGATTGAIPKVGDLPQGPALPLPPNEHVQPQPVVGTDHQPLLQPEKRQPLLRLRHADLQIPKNVPQGDLVKPAHIEMPRQPKSNTDDRSFTPVLPVSARNSEAVSRAQSPESSVVPAAILSALKDACIGYVTKIDVVPDGPRKLELHLTLVPGVLADRLAQRIAQIPDLAGWEVELHFVQ